MTTVAAAWVTVVARGWRCESRRAAILAAATLAVATPAPPPSPPPSPPFALLAPVAGRPRRLLDCHPCHATLALAAACAAIFTHAIGLLMLSPPPRLFWYLCVQIVQKAQGFIRGVDFFKDFTCE